jgi:hypothetical protein
MTAGVQRCPLRDAPARLDGRRDQDPGSGRPCKATTGECVRRTPGRTADRGMPIALPSRRRRQATRVEDPDEQIDGLPAPSWDASRQMAGMPGHRCGAAPALGGAGPPPRCLRSTSCPTRGRDAPPGAACTASSLGCGTLDPEPKRLGCLGARVLAVRPVTMRPRGRYRYPPVPGALSSFSADFWSAPSAA